MKYRMGFKIIAILLAVCALVAGIGSAVGVIILEQMGMYTSTLDNWQSSRQADYAWNLAFQVLNRYTAVSLGNCTDQQLGYAGRDYTDEELSLWCNLDPNSWDYSIAELSGNTVETTYSNRLSGDICTYSFELSTDYPVHVSPSELELYEASSYIWRDYYCTEAEEHYLYYYDSPVYTVTIRMLPGAFTVYDGLSFSAVTQLFSIRFWLIGILAASILVFTACAVYLGFAAGRSSRDQEVRLMGLNRLPLDLYAAAVVVCCILLAALTIWILETFFFNEASGNLYVLIPASAVVAVAAALIVGLFYAVVAQVKMRGGYWWRHSIIGWCPRKLWQGVRFCFRGLQKLVKMLPLIWQWLLTAAVMVLVPLFFLLLIACSYGLADFLWTLLLVASIFCDIGIVCYGAYAFGTLLKGAKRMAEGNLNTKVSTKYLFGPFADFAQQLNALADTAVVAAKNQMKSERMKTELITNVSHDIKTPLTSIINYVDLLQKPHTEDESVQYLNVLARQSQRLKKLIDDLMDMSKATTGNMNVDITQVDTVEAINQALGEFADKLEACQLTPVFRQLEHTVAMQADGRLTWRVLSNLLSNIVKYALPGTRVYIDLAQLNGQVMISLKNISREELNVSADELTERFVRGDASRNTEGSGLGLNIAKSLMELQRGQLQLLVDGDLFKVTLTFPAS